MGTQVPQDERVMMTAWQIEPTFMLDPRKTYCNLKENLEKKMVNLTENLIFRNLEIYGL